MHMRPSMTNGLLTILPAIVITGAMIASGANRTDEVADEIRRPMIALTDVIDVIDEEEGRRDEHPTGASGAPLALRKRSARIVPETLPHEAGPGATLAWAPFSDLSLVATVVRRVDRGERGYTLSGEVGEHGRGWFVLSVHHPVVVGVFNDGEGRQVELRPAGANGDRFNITEVDPAAYGGCGVCEGRPSPVNDSLFPQRDSQARPAARRPDGRTSSGTNAGTNAGTNMATGDGTSDGCEFGPDDGSIIDVMVVWTPAARASAGGVKAMEALVEAAVESTNLAYTNSGIAPEIRLVYKGEVDYRESGSMNTDLVNLRQQNEVMPEVHTIRQEVGADLVALLTHGSGLCGLGYVLTTLESDFAPFAFSVTRWQCAVGNLSFAHELGHNMGCGHDHQNVLPSLFDDSFGHRWTGDRGTLWRSIMALQPGERVPHFSNPEIDFDGQPTGVAEGFPEPANHARTINESACYVANFMPSVDSEPACPADLTGDGTVNVFDLLQLLDLWGACESCSADLTGDGVVDVFDLLTLLAAWGPC